MDDLDILLEDLGRGKSSSSPASTATKKPSRPISSRVDLNELENLMEDLAAPTQKKTPQITSSVSSVSQSKKNVVEIKPTVAELKPTVTEPKPTVPEPKSVLNTSVQSSAPVSIPSSSTNSENVDDLEALMESLNVSSNSRASRRTNNKPVSNVSSSPINPDSEPAKVESTSSVTQKTTASIPETKPYVSPSYNSPSNNLAPSYNLTPTPAYVPPPSGGPVKGDDLDRLLSNLTSQMDNIEPENPNSRGTCATCKGAILGEMMQALGRCYHPEHFQCGNCREPIGTRNFYEQNGNPHCQNCFQNLFCPKCGHCDNPILDRCITAMGKKFHPEHFICSQCLKPFPNGNFFEKDGRAYCENDFFNLFANKCGACHEPIKGDCINALGQQWHPEHFVCTYCGKSFSGTFFEHNGKPYCEAHYHQQTGSCCGGCGKPITGRCVNALDKKWHPEHFVCAFCMNPLAGGSFSEKNNKAYCKECHSKLFGS